MDQNISKEIEKIKSRITCNKDFLCLKSDLIELCEAKDVGIESMLECLEENPGECTFSFVFDNSVYCKCPIRYFVSKKLLK
ncbi:MAG: hypothetical protein JSW04_04450 [Desulfobacterales bacterium]|nr:MAG: hypothetical protein JSW04_04450 [Desulfobacterales bacterium]